jgi:hypothetical protein
VLLIAAGNGQCWPYTTPATTAPSASRRLGTTVTWSKTRIILNVTCNPSRAISACLDSPANSRVISARFLLRQLGFLLSRAVIYNWEVSASFYTVIRIVSLLVGCLNVEHRELFPAVLRNMNWTELVPVIVMPMLVRTLRADRRMRHLQQSIWNILHVLSFDTGCSKKIIVLH